MPPLKLTITSLNENGYGVAQKAGQTLTVARTAPGDQVLTGAPHSAAKWSSADLIKVVAPGPDRVDSPCAAFSAGCGGCQWLHLTYAAQLAWKEKNLAAVLRERAAYRGKIEPLVAMADPTGYRNKLSLKNAGGKWVFVPEFDGAPVSPAQCLVQTPALQAAWAFLRTKPAPAALEQLHLRSNAAGQVGVHVFAKEGEAALEKAITALLAGCPGVVGWGVTTRKGYRPGGGEPVLAQTLPKKTGGSTTWLLPHNGFFQTNAVQANELLALVQREARITRNDRVLDLYCGVGFFGLALAPQAREVVGIEENPQSVAAAEASARHSGLTNTRFLAGDLGPVLATLDPTASEIAVVDPPREGLLPRALEALIARSPRRLVYISCYAPSLARDYKVLVKAGYRGISCTAIDMFPQTSHLETVLTLERS